MRRAWIFLGLCRLSVAALSAQDNSELLTRMKAMEERIQALEAEVKALKGKPEAKPEPITISTAPQEKSAEPLAQAAPTVIGPGGLPYYGAQTLGNKLFNPEIAAIGTFRGAAGFGASRPTPSL